LLDFKASTYLIDKDFSDRHKLPLIIKKYYIPIEVIDGRPLVAINVIHKTTLLDIILEGYHCIIASNVIKSPSNPIVLSLSIILSS
jgi:hypothetical protein